MRKPPAAPSAPDRAQNAQPRSNDPAPRLVTRGSWWPRTARWLDSGQRRIRIWRPRQSRGSPVPVQTVSGVELEYWLACVDGEGAERTDDPDGIHGRLVPRIVGELAREPYTDVFLMSHGWMGDVPAAVRQYDRWIGAMAACHEDLERARQVRPGFRPLLIGFHWPSRPFGGEELGRDPGVCSRRRTTARPRFPTRGRSSTPTPSGSPTRRPHALRSGRSSTPPRPTRLRPRFPRRSWRRTGCSITSRPRRGRSGERAGERPRAVRPRRGLLDHVQAAAGHVGARDPTTRSRPAFGRGEGLAP
jgi:hypothetical protein